MNWWDDAMGPDGIRQTGSREYGGTPIILIESLCGATDEWIPQNVRGGKFGVLGRCGCGKGTQAHQEARIATKAHHRANGGHISSSGGQPLPNAVPNLPAHSVSSLTLDYPDRTRKPG